MRDFYSRRRGEARKLLLIPPTRLMLTRGAPQKKVEDTKVFHKEEAKRFHKEDAKEELDNEVEGASSSSSFRSILRPDVSSRRSWEVRREELDNEVEGARSSSSF